MLPALLKKRNLEVKEVKANKPGYFTTAINVKIATAKGTHKIEGTLFDGKQLKLYKSTNIMLTSIPKATCCWHRTSTSLI